MDYTQFTAVKNRLSVSPNLCDLFKLLSVETWMRLKYAYIKAGVKVFETTLTQNLIFTINAFNDQYGLNIEILEALDEDTNGNDFELIIRYPNEGIEFYAPIQAKKLYRNGKYSSMDHGDQIKTLIDYASVNNANPFYLLYNYTTSPLSIINGVYDIELLGCTLISAKYLFENFYNKRESVDKNGSILSKWLIPSFNDLHLNHAIPWHELLCGDSIHYLLNILQDIKVLPDNPIVPTLNGIMSVNQSNNGFFPINTFVNGNEWVSLKDTDFGVVENTKYFYSRGENGKTIKIVDDNNRESEKKEKSFSVFSPQSRIVITKE